MFLFEINYETLDSLGHFRTDVATSPFHEEALKKGASAHNTFDSCHFNTLRVAQESKSFAPLRRLLVFPFALALSPRLRHQAENAFRCPIDLYEVNAAARLRHAVAASRACPIILHNGLSRLNKPMDSSLYTSYDRGRRARRRFYFLLYLSRTRSLSLSLSLYGPSVSRARVVCTRYTFIIMTLRINLRVINYLCSAPLAD